MTITGDDLGVLEDLAVALGVFGEDGQPDPGWFGDPGSRLGQMLANDTQREALIAFMDAVLDDGDVDETNGRSFVPIVKVPDPDIVVGTFFAAGAGIVDVGIYAELRTTAAPPRPKSTTRLELPLFRAKRGNGPAVANPILLGQPGGRIRLTSAVELSAAAPLPGQFHLGSIGLSVDVPTTASGDGAPVIGLVLGQLQLPGSSPRDFDLRADSVDDLDDVVLELVLGLVQAQAGSAGGVLGAVAGMLGLRPGLPPLPIEDLLGNGVRALATWLETILSNPTHRGVWLGHLAALVGGAVTATGDGVSFVFGIATLTVGVRTAPDAAGRTTVTPFVEASVGPPGEQARAVIDLLSSNLASGHTVGLPRAALFAELGRPANGNQTLALDIPAAPPAPAVRVEAVRLGIELNGERQPLFVLAADRVTIGTQQYATIDLTSTDALMDVAGAAVNSVVGDLLDRLGPFGQAAQVLFGLAPPAGHPAVPTIDLPALAADPIGAIFDHWKTLLTAHSSAVPTVLGMLRETLASTSAAATVTGSGTVADPWRVPLGLDVALRAYVEASVLHVGLAAGTRVDNLGQRCTVIEADLVLELATIDLARRSASIGTQLAAHLTMRARGMSPPQALFDLDVATLAADHVGVVLTWSPAGGLRFGIDAPNLRITIGERPPLLVPELATLSAAALDDLAWDAVERLIGMLAPRASTWISALTGVLGWSDDGPRLRLADLVGPGSDPLAAISAWLAEALIARGTDALGFLADALLGDGGLTGAFAGLGTPEQPFELALGGDGAATGTHLLAWFPPAGPEPTFTRVADAIRLWRTGDSSLSAEVLAAAMIDEGALANDIADLVWNRDVTAGIDALVARWTGGDGRIVPPATPPAGVAVIELADLAASQLVGAIDAVDLLGRAPAVVVHVAVGTSSESTWPDVDPARRIALAEPNRAPESFAATPASTGEWFVTLGGRDACRLATGDPDGTLGQAARLSRVLASLAGLGPNQVLVGHGAAGQACRLAAAASPTISDLITTATPLGPVSLTVLDELAAGDVWRLLQSLLPPDDGDDDAELARGRALVRGFAEIDRETEPGKELREPLGGVPGRAGLTHHAVFGVIDHEAARRAITAVIVSGLARRAIGRADAVAGDLPPATGVRTAVRLPARTDAGALVVDGCALVDLGGWDLGPTGVTTAGDRAVRVRLRIGGRDGWLAGGPDPARGPARPRDHALRAIAVDVVLPRGAGSTATPFTRISLLDGTAFGIHRERWDVVAGGEPVAAEVRLLLSLAIQRIVAEASATTPSVVAVHLRSLLQALGLTASDGSVADAIESLVHQPHTLIATALSSPSTRETVATAVRGLLGAEAPTGGDASVIRVASDSVTTVIDLDRRSVDFGAPSGGGRFGWSAHIALDPSKAGLLDDWSVRIGSDPAVEPPGNPAGGAWATFDQSGARFNWRLAGDAAPHTLPLWPQLDVGQAGSAITTLAPALLGQAALELLREVDETARPVIDAALDAFGMLDSAVADFPRVRLPLGLIHNPIGWLNHSAAIARQPSRAIGIIEAVKPLLGVAGGLGVLELAPGVRLTVADQAGAIKVTAGIATDAFGTPLASTVGRLSGRVGATILIGDGAPTFGVELSVGLAGSVDDRRAIHVTVGPDLRVVLRPAIGSDISLYPPGPGLAAAAVDQIIGQALPFVLDTLAAQTSNDLKGDIGKVVAAIGDALGLRDATPSFVYERLRTWATDPVAALTAASTNLLAPAIPTLAPLVDSLLPAAVNVTPVPEGLRVAAGPVSLIWRPSPFRVEVAASASTLPGIGAAAASFALTSTGLDALTLEVGPVSIPVGPVQITPFLSVAAGANPAGGRNVALGLDVDGTRRLAARWLLDSSTMQLVVLDGATVDATPAAVSAALVEAVATLAASVALATPEVADLLATTIPTGAGTTTVGQLLDGVILTGTGALDTGVFQLSSVRRRVVRLIDNLAGAGLSVKVSDLRIGIGRTNGVAGLTLGLTNRVELLSSDVTLSLEIDDSWIDPKPTLPGVTVGLVRLAGTTITFEPTLTVAGVGLRISKASGPLLDFGVTLESIAIHSFASVSSTERSGGVQLQFGNLAVSPGGATGGNAIAQGILADSGSAGQKPAPKFSPALAVQKHGTAPIAVTLRAGPGDGPWWIAIQKGFGPLYIEQVGLGVAMPARKVESISLLLDARVSLFGLSASVDDLSVTYFVSKGDFFNAANWGVDLRGLAIAAEIGPLSIAGGLLKSGDGDNVEYLGMLLGRFGIYGVTIYGGYGKNNGVVSFFAVGAVVGPIGGPPAFFVTGIGGGFGINRRLVVPTDLSQFATFPLIQALDVAAQAPADPMQQLRDLGKVFPAEAGSFWFAGGISFNSFALVDGIAVVAMQFGDGFEISLLGLARMALPRPQVAIVSIELALVARISSKEGVVWVQGQLTDNSWLLYPDVRLTGGFAFVVWFAGPHRGEFVLSIGGFHPDFKRDGYPVVPRLGLQWRFGPVVVKGGSYFALTSEAVMAGVEVEASASFGWAWANATFGAHGIVFFDPFHYKVSAYARVSAGVTIDTWFGDISFSVSVGARIEVEGPDFRGKVTVEVGPCDVTLKFGSTANNATPTLSAAEFVPKYLEEAVTGVARAITSIISAGAMGPGPTASGKEQNPPDGTPARPFVVTAEFVMTVTTLVPAAKLAAGAAPVSHPPTRSLGVAPMGITAIDPVLTFAWQRDGGAAQPWPFSVATRPFGSFPVGVWGKPQDAASPHVPEGEVIDALNEVQLTATASISPPGPAIKANRLDPPDKRRPLPFLRHTAAARTSVLNGAKRLETLLATVQTPTNSLELATSWKSIAGASPVELATFGGHRIVQPRLGSLGDRLARRDGTVVPDVATPVAKVVVDTTVFSPHALAVLGAGSALPDGRWAATTVSNRPRMRRVAPPSMEALKGTPAAARLVVSDRGVQRAERTVVPIGSVASTRATRSAPVVVAMRGSDGLDRLGELTNGIAARARGSRLRAGETVVLALPNARRDVAAGARPTLAVRGCATRVVTIADGGDVLSDAVVVDDVVSIPQGAERLVVAALGDPAPNAGLAGWHSGLALRYVGWSIALCPAATIRVSGAIVGRHRARGHAGFAEAAEMVTGQTTVTTRFADPVDVVLIVIDDPSVEADLADPAGRRLLIGLDGAAQAADGSAEPVPPIVVAAGNRSVLAYRVVPQPAPTGAARPVSVTVASGSGWHVVGVLGGVGDPATVAAGAAAIGFDAALGSGTPPGSGEAQLHWQPVPGTKSAAPRLRATPGAPPKAAPAKARRFTKKRTPTRRRRRR